MRSALPGEIALAIGEESIGIEVTTRCNGACGHCFARAGRERAIDLDAATAMAIAEEGRAIGYRHLHITGGEPLLWGPLFELIHHASDLGYESVFINTNGTLLDDDAAKRLTTRGGFVTLSISIQGPEDIHDRMRGPGSHGAAVDGMERALASGIPVYVFTAVGRSLLAGLPRFAEDLFNRHPGARELTLIQMIRVHGDAFDLTGELLSPAEFISLVKMAALLNLWGLRVAILRNPLATVVSGALSIPWIAPSAPLHRGGGIMIMADGSLTCAHSTRDSLGGYGRGALSGALASTAYLASVMPDDGACGGCRHLPLCSENGMLRPSEGNRDMDGSSPFCVRVLDAVGMEARGAGRPPEGATTS